ncbi:carboxymuconolactone decarboxylase family protein [Dactylosporangium sp. NPDC051541]|uniref:carboxymuconolactone decarboxylase family protein n=1 Tax=Dactylosporangium sp. NPDC051541 TaxID=3363977 RepID=UPI0037B7C50E
MIGFLHDPEPSAGAERLYADDIDELGYVMNVSKLWAYAPDVCDDLFGLMRSAVAGRLPLRTRAILVVAATSAFGDSYCALAWGEKLIAETATDTAAGVVTGADTGLTDAERALAAWARRVARDPAATTEADVETLRTAGYSDADIFAMTVFIALRIAFATVNDALGVQPDAQLADRVPAELRAAVTFGRAPARP